MESIYPYRIAWRRPPDVNVCHSSRSAVLEAMEYGHPTSKARIAALSDLSANTVRHASRQLTREKVLTLKYGPDPDTAVASDLITIVRYPVLPVLEITDAYMVWRLMDTCGESVFATVRDRGGFCSPADDLTTLLGQAATIMGAGTCGLPAEVALQPPVLLLPSRDPKLVSLVRRETETEPDFILTPEEATALELRYNPVTQHASSILYVRSGEVRSVSLLQRMHLEDPRSTFYPTPFTAGLERSLREYTRGVRPHTGAWWQRAAGFLAECVRYLSPDLVVVETDRPGSDPKALRKVLPPSIPLLHLPYALNTPSLAHRGAMRLSRRVLWDGMESEKP